MAVGSLQCFQVRAAHDLLLSVPVCASSVTHSLVNSTLAKHSTNLLLCPLLTLAKFSHVSLLFVQLWATICVAQSLSTRLSLSHTVHPSLTVHLFVATQSDTLFQVEWQKFSIVFTTLNPETRRVKAADQANYPTIFCRFSVGSSSFPHAKPEEASVATQEAGRS